MTSAAQIATSPVAIDTPRLLKVGHCPSLSGKSQLTYLIGCHEEGGILFQVYANSAKGYFNREWVRLDHIAALLKDRACVTSFTLQSLFIGRSQNNGGFLLAALRNEGAILTSELNERGYRWVEPIPFMEEMTVLMASDITLDPDAKPKKPSRKKALPDASPSAE